jgi:hypothetical protein
MRICTLSGLYPIAGSHISVFKPSASITSGLIVFQALRWRQDVPPKR